MTVKRTLSNWGYLNEGQSSFIVSNSMSVNMLSGLLLYQFQVPLSPLPSLAFAGHLATFLDPG